MREPVGRPREPRDNELTRLMERSDFSTETMERMVELLRQNRRPPSPSGDERP